MIEYRAILIQPASHAVLTFDVAGSYCLPRVRIPQWTRPAQELRKSIQATWGLKVIILEIVVTDYSDTSCVVAELLTPETTSDFEVVKLNEVLASELSDEERSLIELLLAAKSRHSCSHMGWIDEAVAWVENVSGRRVSSKKDIEQLNAGSGFALLRIPSDDGQPYWLKATGEPNTHELSVVSFLSEICPSFLPRLVGTKKEWNAWLTEHTGNPLPNPPTGALLIDGAKEFAAFQLRTVDHVESLLTSRVFDQRVPTLRVYIDELIAYLIDAMCRQNSVKVAPLTRDRLLELGEILLEVCIRMEALCIPDTLIHNDLNPGNILFDGTKCVFTDWSEAAVGNPFLSYCRFCQLSVHETLKFESVYRECWTEYLSEGCMDEAFSLTPLLAILAYLYGRGDWLKSTSKISSRFESHARSLARHMDRAASDPGLLKVLYR